MQARKEMNFIPISTTLTLVSTNTKYSSMKLKLSIASYLTIRKKVSLKGFLVCTKLPYFVKSLFREMSIL